MSHFRQIPALAEGSFAYLLADLDKGEAVLIDPCEAQIPLYLGLLDEIKARLVRILLTHSHTASQPAAQQLRDITAAPLSASPATPLRDIDQPLADGETIAFGDELLRALHTPGHTAGCMTYLWRDRAFTGDTLLIGDCGSTEEAGSDPGLLYDSLTRRLLCLPDETLVYPAHDASGRCVTCIGEQRSANQRLTGITRDEFISAYRRQAP